LFQEALLSCDPDSWEFLLSRVMVEESRKKQRMSFTIDEQWSEYGERVEHFEALLRETTEIKRKRLEALVPLWARLADGTISLEEKQRILKEAFEYDPENRMIPGTLAYYAAALESWPDAIGFLKGFPIEEGRPNALWMRLSLLEAQMLHHQGLASEADEALNDACRRIRDPWFLAICACLQGRQTEEALGSFLTDWPEYDFVRERIKRLKKTGVSTPP
jgi:hypothetical protein